MPDVLFILLLALIIFGPKRLPEIARQIAKLMVQFRMMKDDLKRRLNRELLKIELEEKRKETAAVLPELQAPDSRTQPQGASPLSAIK